MSAITKEQLIEDLKASTQNSSGMFEISDDTICSLMSMLTCAAPQLPQPAVPEYLENLRSLVADKRALPRRKEWVSGQQYSYVLLENVEGLVEEACRDAMLQGAEPSTDNTNQQFESLSRGDK